MVDLRLQNGRSNRGVPMSLENDNNISKILGIHKPMDTVMFPHPSFWLKSTLEQSPKWTSFSAMGFNLFPSLPQQTPVRVKCRQQFLRPDQKERRLRMWEPACEGKTDNSGVSHPHQALFPSVNKLRSSSCNTEPHLTNKPHSAISSSWSVRQSKHSHS